MWGVGGNIGSPSLVAGKRMQSSMTYAIVRLVQPKHTGPPELGTIRDVVSKLGQLALTNSLRFQAVPKRCENRESKKVPTIRVLLLRY